MFKKLSILLLLFLGLSFSAGVLTTREGLAVDAPGATQKRQLKTTEKSSGQKTDKNIIQGIFYDGERSRVLIGDILYSLNDYYAGGKIVHISPDAITLEFPYKQKEYRLGDLVVDKETQETAAQEKSKETVGYVNKSNSLVQDLLAKQNENAALFMVKGDMKTIRAISTKMSELIKEEKQQLVKLSAPSDCKRMHILAIKIFDLGEKGWQAAMEGNRDKAEAFFGYITRVSQEITQEAASLIVGRK